MATWSASYVEIIDMHRCGFYTGNNQCGSRTFLSSFALAFGQPILASIVMDQHRLFSLAGPSVWMILTGSLLLHESQTPGLFFRDITNCERFGDGAHQLTTSLPIPVICDRSKLLGRA